MSRLLVSKIAILLLLMAGVLSAQQRLSGGRGRISSGTDKQVACYLLSSTTLADCDCTFTFDGTNGVLKCPTDSATGFQFQDKDGNVILNIDTLSDTGRVGIGIAAPLSTLHVESSDSAIARFVRNSSSSGSILIGNTTHLWSFGLDAAETLFIKDNTSLGKAFQAEAGLTVNPIYVASDGSVGVGPSNTNPDGTFLCKDGTTTTGSTLCSTQAGDGQGTDDLYRWRNNAGGILASVGFAGRVNASGVSASESYKSGLAVVLGGDTSHDIDAAAGIAQSFDQTHNIVFAAQVGKQLDVKWATGAAAGMLGMPDLTPAIVLTFSLTANPDTITAGSETPFAICNDGGTETGTIIIQGGSTNNGTYEVASCTDTVLTLGNGVLSGDETGDSGEYEARYVQPDTWYHVFLIELAGTEDICADTSEIAANCLSESSYDMWRLLQSVLTDATANLVTF